MKDLTLDAVIENIDPVTDFVNDELEKLGCPPKARIQIDVAIDELFGNIARYAYSGPGGKATVRFDYDPETCAVTISFIDSGEPFDPLSRDDPDVTLSIDQRRIGGLGIFVVKKSMDSVEYEYTGGCNVLRIRKVLK